MTQGSDADPADVPQPGDPVPALLHSVYEGGPFRRCSVCDAPLEDASLFEVQKVFRGPEVIFEYAVCRSCGMNLLKSYSRESLEIIQSFFSERYEPGCGWDRCHFCGRDVQQGRDDYSLMALCAGGTLAGPVILMCNACNEGISETLSRKTREAFGDFIEDNFPGVPAEWETPVAPLGL